MNIPHLIPLPASARLIDPDGNEHGIPDGGFVIGNGWALRVGTGTYVPPKDTPQIERAIAAIIRRAV